MLKETNVINKKTNKKKKKLKKDKYVSKTISVKMNKKKENDINKILNKLNSMNIKDIHKKLEDKGINTKIKNKDKLLKYMYLLTCVDDNINVIKG